MLQQFIGSLSVIFEISCLCSGENQSKHQHPDEAPRRLQYSNLWITYCIHPSLVGQVDESIFVCRHCSASQRSSPSSPGIQMARSLQLRLYLLWVKMTWFVKKGLQLEENVLCFQSSLRAWSDKAAAAAAAAAAETLQQRRQYLFEWQRRDSMRWNTVNIWNNILHL